MRSILIDPTGREISLTTKPRSIVSCVPSQSELLFDLGLEDCITGITKFCVRPAHALSKKQIIGGTKNLRLEKIAQLEPDLIVANKEENERHQIEWLANRFPTYTSDVRTLDHAYTMISELGELTGSMENAMRITENIQVRLAPLMRQNTSSSVAYIIWKNPLMTVNSDTFINDLLSRIGLVNVFAGRIDSRYPVISEHDLLTSRPDFIFLSSEPYPFKSEHQRSMAIQFPHSKVMLVDGEMFSWYGSRLLAFDVNFIQELR